MPWRFTDVFKHNYDEGFKAGKRAAYAEMEAAIDRWVDGDEEPPDSASGGGAARQGVAGGNADDPTDGVERPETATGHPHPASPSSDDLLTRAYYLISRMGHTESSCAWNSRCERCVWSFDYLHRSADDASEEWAEEVIQRGVEALRGFYGHVNRHPDTDADAVRLVLDAACGDRPTDEPSVAPVYTGPVGPAPSGHEHRWKRGSHDQIDYCTVCGIDRPESHDDASEERLLPATHTNKKCVRCGSYRGNHDYTPFGPVCRGHWFEPVLPTPDSWWCSRCGYIGDEGPRHTDPSKYKRCESEAVQGNSASVHKASDGS